MDDGIDPVLCEKSVWWYWFRQYALAPLFPSLGTVQIGPGPNVRPDGARIQGVKSADVDLGDAGSNAERVQKDEVATGAEQAQPA